MRIISNHNRALGSLMFVALSYSLLSVVSRCLNIGFQPFTQVYLRVLGAMIMSVIIFRKNINYKKILNISPSDLLWVGIMGVLGYGIMVYFATIGSLNASLLNISVIMATVPFFSYILSLIFLKTVFNFKILLLAFISFIGVSIIASKSFIPNFTSFGKGEIFVLIGALLLAVYSVSRKKISSYLNNQEITILVIFLAFLTTFTMSTISGEKLEWSSFSIPIVIVALIVGSVLNILCTFLETYSFQHLEAVVGNQILLLENLFSPLLGYFLYREGLDIFQLIGASIIVGSVYFNNKNQIY